VIITGSLCFMLDFVAVLFNYLMHFGGYNMNQAWQILKGGGYHILLSYYYY